MVQAESIFPDPSEADEDGIVAVGGRLSTDVLLDAYSNGIFPWPHSRLLLWFSPDPRCILRPAKAKASGSMLRLIKSGRFKVTCDQAFEEVIRACSRIARKGETGTWITARMIEAYCRLHAEGFAHSFEAWHDGDLAGGLYGVSLGRAFFGESMFSRISNASKACFLTMAKQLHAWQFDFIDCQLPTGHLLSLGAETVPRPVFLAELSKTLEHGTRSGAWRLEYEPQPGGQGLQG